MVWNETEVKDMEDGAATLLGFFYAIVIVAVLIKENRKKRTRKMSVYDQFPIREGEDSEAYRIRLRKECHKARYPHEDQNSRSR